MPQIMLKTFSSNEDWSGNCDYAVIDLDQELVTTILRRIALLNDLRSEESSDLFNMTYWDSHARFFPYTDSLEELLDKVDEQDLVINKEPVHIPEEALSWVECQQMLIFSDNVCWQAIPKHSSIRVETASVTLSAIENIKGGLKPA